MRSAPAPPSRTVGAAVADQRRSSKAEPVRILDAGQDVGAAKAVVDWRVPAVEVDVDRPGRERCSRPGRCRRRRRDGCRRRRRSECRRRRRRSACRCRRRRSAGSGRRSRRCRRRPKLVERAEQLRVDDERVAGRHGRVVGGDVVGEAAAHEDPLDIGEAGRREDQRDVDIVAREEERVEAGAAVDAVGPVKAAPKRKTSSPPWPMAVSLPPWLRRKRSGSGVPVMTLCRCRPTARRPGRIDAVDGDRHRRRAAAGERVGEAVGRRDVDGAGVERLRRPRSDSRTRRWGRSRRCRRHGGSAARPRRG